MLPRLRLPNRQTAALLASLVVLAVVTAWLYFDFPRSVVDDAYIYARYAGNLAAHGQLTWNPGGDPVEGCTGPLLAVLYAAWLQTGLPVETFIPILGLACFFGAGLALVLSLRRAPLASFLVALLYCLSPFLYRHAFSGMDTALFTCLLALAFALAGANLQPRSPRLFSLVLLLLALVRPEGLLYALTLAAGVILTARRKQQALWLALLFLLPYAAVTLWRWGYYGRLLPNPYYIKTPGGWVEGSLDEIRDFFLGNSFTLPLAVLTVLGLGLWLFGRRRLSPPSNGWLLAAVALLPLALILLQYARSTLSMGFSHRFLAPYYPLLLLCFGGFFDAGLHTLAALPRRKGWLAALSLAFCALSLGLAFPSAYRSERREANLGRRLMQSENIAIGRKLGQALPREETLVVLKDAGAVPYYSGLRTIDLGGLNDAYLAHDSPNNAEVLDYIFASRPGVFVITSYSAEAPDRSLLGGDQGLLALLLADQRFAEYKLVEIFYPPVQGMQYFEFVYLRSDLTDDYSAVVQRK